MMSTSSLSRRPNRSPLLRWRVASKRFRPPARQSPRKPAVKPSGRLMFKPGRLAVCRAPSTANSRTCHHEPSTRPSPACARSSVLTRKQPPIQPKSTVLYLGAIPFSRILPNILDPEVLDEEPVLLKGQYWRCSGDGVSGYGPERLLSC